MPVKPWLTASFLTLTAACTCVSPPPSDSSDAGVDAGRDAGIDAGAVDAGPRPMCSPGCQAWQQCVPTADAGICQDVTLSFLTPMAGNVFDAGALIQLAVVATLPNQTTPSMPVPLTSTVAGIPSSITSGRGPIDIRLPATEGEHLFTAGWDGGPKTSVNVFTRACSKTCAPYEECQDSVAGGTCVSADLQLAWQLPADGTKLNRNQTIGAAISVTKRDGGTPLIARLPVQNSAEPFTCSMNTCVGTVGNLSDPDGARDILAGWDGGPLAARSFILDTRGPQLAIIVQNGGAEVKRDQVVSMILTSDEALSDAGVTFAGDAVTPVATVNCAGYGSYGNAVGCYQLDFSKPVLNAMDGGFVTAASAVDSVGNSSVATPVTTLVTRLRWSAHPAPSDSYATQAIALDPSGNIYVGYRLGPSEGSIYKIRALDGQTLFSTPDAGAVMSLSIADNVLFYAANKPNGVIGGIDLPTMSPSASGPCGPIGSAPTYSGIALRTFSGRAAALGVLSGEPSRLCEFRPGDVAFAQQIGDAGSAIVPDDTKTASNIVVSGTTASITTGRFGNAAVNATYWIPIYDLDQPLRRVGEAQSLTVGIAFQSGIPVGQAVTPSKRFLIGAGTRVFSANGVDGGMSDGNLNAVAYTGVPAIASATEGYVGRDNQLARFDPSNLTAGAILYNVGTDLFTSPVLGKPRGQGSEGVGYAVSSGGRLVAFGTGAASGPQWSAELGVTVNAHPTLDCNHTSSTSKTGILYVGAANGTLKAIIVDSPGLLDVPGAWPKFQRSAGNSGNDSEPFDTLFPTNWACP